MCGKSLDMIWLAEQGLQVTGIEISALAIETFFAENELDYEVQQIPHGQLYTNKNITIIHSNKCPVHAFLSPPQKSITFSRPATPSSRFIPKIASSMNHGSKKRA